MSATISFDDCTVKEERAQALLIHIPEVSDDPQWVPKANIDKDDSEIKHMGDEGTLVIKEWFAIEKEWV